MTDPAPAPDPSAAPEGDQREVAHGELVGAAPSGPDGSSETGGTDGEGPEERHEAVQEPAKVMRIGSMVKQLLEEVRAADLDGPARSRLKEIYDSSIQEVGSALSPDLRAELDRVAIPFGEDGDPSNAELRIAHAQLVGWLEGLFHGIQATLFAQQMASRGQLEELRRQLPSGGPGGSDGVPGPDGGQAPASHGTYL